MNTPQKMGKNSYLAQVQKYGGEEGYRKEMARRQSIRKHWPKKYRKEEHLTD